MQKIWFLDHASEILGLQEAPRREQEAGRSIQESARRLPGGCSRLPGGSRRLAGGPRGSHEVLLGGSLEDPSTFTGGYQEIPGCSHETSRRLSGGSKRLASGFKVIYVPHVRCLQRF